MSLLGPRRLSVFTIGGQRIDLLNFRLSMIDRNFDHRDYELLLALDTRSAETPNFGSHPPTPVPKRRIEALQLMKKDSNNNNSGGNNKGSLGSGDDIVCSICLDTFADDVLVMKLPCGHEFHDGCAQDWFARKGMGSTCPNCQRQVFK